MGEGKGSQYFTMDLQQCVEILAAHKHSKHQDHDNCMASGTRPDDKSTSSKATGVNQPAQSCASEAALELPQCPVALFRGFTSHQSQRVEVYGHFESGFQAMLAARDFKNYEALCSDTTKVFAAISLAIIEHEKALRACATGGASEASEAADIIRRVQKLEKEKLEVCAALQVEQLRLQTSSDSLRLVSMDGGGGAEEATSPCAASTTPDSPPPPPSGAPTSSAAPQEEASGGGAGTVAARLMRDVGLLEAGCGKLHARREALVEQLVEVMEEGKYTACELRCFPEEEEEGEGAEVGRMCDTCRKECKN